MWNCNTLFNIPIIFYFGRVSQNSQTFLPCFLRCKRVHFFWKNTLDNSCLQTSPHGLGQCTKFSSFLMLPYKTIIRQNLHEHNPHHKNDYFLGSLLTPREMTCSRTRPCILMTSFAFPAINYGSSLSSRLWRADTMPGLSRNCGSDIKTCLSHHSNQGPGS